ncbi:hypothetical protein CMO88_02595 [Candidatus Woesearchaeota archaeon]|nr:hypothetical protein [Candidatus Woesearchaeota archaeon]|tara:strand:- start:3863 stop:4267 length:405 start_codon:yes stop_codon:yes gene_type:complete
MGYSASQPAFTVVLMKIMLIKSKLLFLIAIALSKTAYAQENAVQTYFGYVKLAIFELFSSLRDLGMSTKLAILAGLVSIALIIYFRTRDTASNNMRRARDLHKKASELHDSGNPQEAEDYYQKANTYREKAETQ